MTHTIRTGHVPAGVHSIRYNGYTSHALPSPKGLIVEGEDEKTLVLVSSNGHRRHLCSRLCSWSPEEPGIAVQHGGKYSLVSYQGKHTVLYQQKVPYAMRCCNTGMIAHHRESDYLYIPFDGGEPHVFCHESGVNAVVDDGIVIGSWERHNWRHVKITGESRVIYSSPDHRYDSGMAAGGFVWAECNGELRYYHWDGRDPAVVKYADCGRFMKYGGCREGAVILYHEKIVIYPFGNKEKYVIWEDAYNRWHGSSNHGLFIVKDGQVLLLPYDGGTPIALWEGPFDDIRPSPNALIVKTIDRRQTVMIPLGQFNPKPAVAV